MKHYFTQSDLECLGTSAFAYGCAHSCNTSRALPGSLVSGILLLQTTGTFDSSRLSQTIQITQPHSCRLVFRQMRMH